MNQHEPNASPGSSTILVADDNVELREIARELLESEGYTVLEAASGDETVQIASEQRPDLVLLDLAMPESSGLEALRALKDDPAWQPAVIILSAYALFMLADDARLADDMVQKPYEADDLLERIERVLARHQAFQ